MIEILLIDTIGEMEPNRWYTEFYRCPSQCFYYTQRDGIDYVLYLRWRWNDPWQAHIVTNARDRTTINADGAEWSEDLFYWKEGLYFEHDEYEQAQAALIDIFAKLAEN